MFDTNFLSQILDDRNHRNSSLELFSMYYFAICLLDMTDDIPER